ncbi:hypothetical protein ABTZ78_17510 [Streptomyces bauhiniae]|uniref:hypothetical protein n=1 Tax=Streptomyces bauhiniae TaxID=2340725 RepID=UPI00331A3EFB
MDSIWSAVIGAGITALIFIGTQVATVLKDRKNDRASAAADARAAVRELVQAALEMQYALAAWDVRRRDSHGIASVIARSVAQILAGMAEDRAYHGMANGLDSAMTYRKLMDDAAEAVVTGPVSRMSAAAARIAMLDDAQLRQASTKVTDALGALLDSYTGRNRDARSAAESAVGEALGTLTDEARAYDGRPRTP